ncbi:MAG: ABC transporter permease [Gemmatimonadaceae bacterium]
MQIRAGVRRWFHLAIHRRALREAEVDEEIRQHLLLRAEQLARLGYSGQEAYDEAVRRFGPAHDSRAQLLAAAHAREDHMQTIERFAAVQQDAKYAIRQLRRSPGFTIAALLTLALGIGANTSMFAAIDALLLRPPAAVSDPDRVVQISYLRTQGGRTSTQSALSFPIYRDMVAATGAFSTVGAYTAGNLTLGHGAEARRARGMQVTAGYFEALGVRPQAGRFFDSTETAEPTGMRVAVVSDRFWREQLEGRRDAIGTPIALGDGAYTVIGVAPAGITGTTRRTVDLWIPLTATLTAEEHANWLASRNAFWLGVVGRLRVGLSEQQASAAATAALHAGMRAQGAEADIERLDAQMTAASVLPRKARRDRPESKVALLLGGVSLLVLLLACANVANLQLARALRRRREIALRVALGVTQRRLMGQVVLESVLLAMAGGFGAIVVAYWGQLLTSRVMLAANEAPVPLDGRVVAYAAAAALAAGILAGLVPALHATRTDIASALKEGSREGGGRSTHSRTRTGLLLLQSALTVLLLAGTGLFVRSLRHLDALRLGMDTEQVLVASVQTAGTSYSAAELQDIYRQLLESARATPGIASATLATSTPFASAWAERVSIPGRDSVPLTTQGGPYFMGVGADYFATLGTRILRGRGFTDADHGGAARVAVINETAARLWWPGENPLGKCMRIGGDTMPCSEVVGIAENSRRFDLIEDPAVQFYMPIDQAPAWTTMRSLMVRPAGEPSPVLPELRRRLQVAVPSLPYISVQPLADQVTPQKRSWRLGATMFGAFGALALILATIGLYAMLAYDVAQRRHEMGVRLALGSGKSRIAALVMGRGLRVAAVGGLIGLALTLVGGRFVGPLLFETSPRDPLVLGGVAALLLVVSAAATLLPALRAVSVSPSEALRSD